VTKVYVLGAVKPWVKTTANEIGNRYNVDTIYGVGARETANSDHPKGLALDFMVGADSQKGDQIAADLQQNWQAYNVTYIIWKQRIWNESRASEGWRAMPDRGSITANHYDHVHVSFQAKAKIVQTEGPGPDGGGLHIPDPLQGVKDSVSALTDVVKFVSDSHNWLRVGMFALGMLLILLALIMLGTGSNTTGAVKKVSKSVRYVRPRNA